MPATKLIYDFDDACGREDVEASVAYSSSLSCHCEVSCGYRIDSPPMPVDGTSRVSRRGRIRWGVTRKHAKRSCSIEGRLWGYFSLFGAARTPDDEHQHRATRRSTHPLFCQDCLLMPEGADASRELSTRLFAPDGEDLGVVTAVAALDLARRLDLDLIPTDEAPFLRPIASWITWKYEQYRNGDPQQGA